MLKPTEAQIQIALFDWGRVYSLITRDYMSAIPNGGSRHVVEARNMKRQGGRAGLSDIFLAWPAWGKHGLWIELKRNDKCKATPMQIEWIDRMNEVGYEACVCYGLDDAISVIKKYIGG